MAAKYFGTFMQRDEKRNNKYVLLDADYNKSRALMTKYYEDQWAFIYATNKLKWQKDMFGIEEIPLGR